MNLVRNQINTMGIFVMFNAIQVYIYIG
jgi:hypothetical protein